MKSFSDIINTSNTSAFSIDQIPFTTTIQTKLPALVDNATGMTLYQATVPGVINSAGGNDTQDFAIHVNSGRFTQGPTGHQIYTDQVLGIGWNMSPAFLPKDATKPATSLRIETKFAQGGPTNVFGSEYHLSHFVIGGAERRYMTAFMPHDDAGAAESAIGFSARKIVFSDYANVGKVTFDYGPANLATWGGGLSHWFPVNNYAVARQGNAAGGSSIALPYIDARDTMPVSAPITTPTTPGVLAENTAGPTVLSRGGNTAALTVGAPEADGASINFFCGTTQTASAAITVVADGSTTITFASGAITPADLQRAITGADVPANAKIISLPTTTSAVISVAMPASVTSIVMSARTRKQAVFGNDASGNLVIRQSTPGGATYFDVRAATGGMIVRDIDAGYKQVVNVTYNAFMTALPFRPGAFTLATLPTASSFPGHMIWVTDATGGAQLCVSIGGSWKVVSVGATVS